MNLEWFVIGLLIGFAAGWIAGLCHLFFSVSQKIDFERPRTESDCEVSE